MRSELVLKFEFEASHSLTNYETPHSHLWKLEVAIGGEAYQGMIVDMMGVRTEVEKLLEDLKGTYLNENNLVDDSVRKAPTCETLDLFFSTRLNEVLKKQFSPLNPTVHLVSVMVTICSVGGTEIGGVRLFST
jgi:6-pyruvoyl-tetrahydropterin synthase